MRSCYAASTLGLDFRSVKRTITPEERPCIFDRSRDNSPWSNRARSVYIIGMADKTQKYKVSKSEAEWKQELTPEQFRVLRKAGTERAFTGRYNNNKEPGVYYCAGCGNRLFSSETKFDSGSGWPSFYAPESDSAVEEHEDKSLFMSRTEVLCSSCGGHLGHVFSDGPAPTGLRYCMNSAALQFERSNT